MIKMKDLVVDLKAIKFGFDDASFEQGKVTVIIGKNGTGKTTLLKTIAGLIHHEGTLEINGEVTYNSQEAIIFNRSVYDNIVYPLIIRKKDLALFEEKIKDYTKVLEIDHLLDKNALKLSSGEKMKVSIVRSIIFSPDIVLLDEPTTHLDIDSIRELVILINKLKKDITFIIVSHNEAFIKELEEARYEVGEHNVLS